MHRNLEQNVSQLFGVVVGGAAIESVEHFIALFHEVGLECFEGLLTIPWAPTFAAKAVDDV